MCQILQTMKCSTTIEHLNQVYSNSKVLLLRISATHCGIEENKAVKRHAKAGTISLQSQ
uniref:Uncharacterized protein n=1 Tax=Arion vulgaris TaxID=1028688 RepID=A0A0B7AV30_9EUPU